MTVIVAGATMVDGMMTGVGTMVGGADGMMDAARVHRDTSCKKLGGRLHLSVVQVLPPG